MNMILKRLLCLLLSILCIFSVTGVFASDEETEEKTAMEAMEALRILEIIPDYYDYNVDMTKEVSRAEFVDAVAKMINANSYQGTVPHFYDVPVSHWAFASIGALTERNILTGNGNKLFYPDEAILMADAYKIILSAMGYGDYANYIGGYPSGYTSAARRVGITEGIVNTGNMTNRDMFILLYQAMNTNIFEGISYDADGVATYGVSEHTLLSVNHNIYMEKGVVNGVNCMSLTRGVLKNENEVQIGDKLYQSDKNLAEYLGEEVEVLFYLDTRTDTKHIKWVRRTGISKILEVTIDEANSFDVNEFKLKYYDKNEKVKYADFLRSGTLIYNGGLVSSNIDTYLNREQYELKLVASDGGKYNVAIMREYKNFIVGVKDDVNARLIDKNNYSNELNLSPKNYTYLTFKSKELVESSFDAIEPGNVLSVFQSADKEYMEIIISDYQEQGEVTSIYEESNGYLLTVNGKAYFYSRSNGNLEIKLGDKVVLHLDFMENIAFFSDQDNGLKAAYLLDAVIKDKSTFSKNLAIKVRHQNGSLKLLEANKSIIIDGVRYKDFEKAYKALLDIDGNVEQQLILIAEDGENGVSAIDTAKVVGTEGANTLQVNVPRANKLWTSNLAGDGRIPMNGSTIVFVIPPPGATDVTEDDYMVISAKEGPSTKVLYTTSYKSREKVGCEQYVVIEWDPTDIEFTKAPILVEEVTTTLDTDGFQIKKIIGYQGGVPVSLELDENLKYVDTRETIGPGSLIHAIIGQNGKLTAFDEYSNPLRAAAGEKFYDTITRISDVLYGRVIDTVDGVIKVDARDGDDTDVRINCAGATVLVWDSTLKKNKVRVGSIADVLPGDYAVVELNYVNARTVVVYK